MPERLWFKIGEAAEFIGAAAHEIRYWEKVIPELRPRRSKGNMRHYHRDDLPKLRCIAAWLKNGYTVAECRDLLTNGSITRDLGLSIDEPSPAQGTMLAKPAIVMPDPMTPAIAPTESMPYIKAQLRAQLDAPIDSLKKLLARLQNPVY